MVVITWPSVAPADVALIVLTARYGAQHPLVAALREHLRER